MTVLMLILCLCWGMQVSYNIMIYVYDNAGVNHEAEKLFLDMQRQDCLPDSFTYLSLVQAYTESLNYSKAEETIHGKESQAKEILSSMKNMRIPFLSKLEVGSAERVKSS
ncbi:Tetratricopeptide-like helical domain superfamily [Sesbania bispinosa]|nr:Tetratricopeptide-like helical domain superfamily [Sesbania bispinosa]